MVSSVFQWVRHSTHRGKAAFMSARPGTGNGGVEQHRPYWLTFEYYVYLFTVLSILGVMTRCAVNVSNVYLVKLLGTLKIAQGFSAGLLKAKFYDGDIDGQFTGFACNMPFLVSLFTVLALVNYLVRTLTLQIERRLAKKVAGTGSGLSHCLRSALHAPHPVILLHFVFGVFFVGFVHGPFVVVPLLLITANYVLATQLQRRVPYQVYMVAIWGFNVLFLHISTYAHGFAGVRWLRILLTGPPSLEHYKTLLTSSASAASDPQAYMQAPLLWRQIMRWQLAYGLVMLRLVAFDYDLWEAHHEAAKSRARATEKHGETCVDCAVLRDRNAHAAGEGEAGQQCASWCYKLRTEFPRETGEYNYITYMAYVLFPPLYLAGPISSYNAYVSHLVAPSTAMRLRDMAVYLVRIVFIYACEMVLLHFIFVNSFLAVQGLMMQLSIVERACLLYFYLAHLWLKFNFIWKTSRLFAFWFGVEAPEDMRNCFSSVTSIQGFWRDWHASFNLWIVRYMYIPMGGRRRKFLSIVPIFLFIAFWHDRELRLLYWALCVCVAFAIELLVQGLFAKMERAVRAQMRQPFGQSPQTELSQSALVAERRSCAACLAHFISHHLSPGQRAFGYRVLCSVASALAAFSMIIANLVGFCVVLQDSSSSMSDLASFVGDTGYQMVKIAREGSVTFYATFALLLFAGCSISTMRRMHLDAVHKHLLEYYKLRS